MFEIFLSLNIFFIDEDYMNTLNHELLILSPPCFAFLCISISCIIIVGSKFFENEGFHFFLYCTKLTSKLCMIYLFSIFVIIKFKLCFRILQSKQCPRVNDVKITCAPAFPTLTDISEVSSSAVERISEVQLVLLTTNGLLTKQFVKLAVEQ